MSASVPERPGAPRALPGGGSARELIEALHALRGAAGEPGYAGRVVGALLRLCRAGAACVVTVEGADVDPATADPNAWRMLAAAGALEDPLRPAWRAELLALTQRAAAQGFASAPGRGGDGAAVWWVAVRLERWDGGFALLAIPDHERPQLNELMLRAQLVADLPAPGDCADLTGAITGREKVEARSVDSATAGRTEALAALLDVAHEIAAEERFGPAVLTLVNSLAARCGAQQVALGWRARGSAQVRLVALSHRDRFDRFSHAVVLTEEALDEALDHEDGAWLDAPAAEGADVMPAPAEAHAGNTPAMPLLAGPTLQITALPPPGETAALPAHALLQQSLGRVALLSLPLARGQDAAHAVLLLAFDAGSAAQGPRWRALLPVALAPLLPWLQTLHLRERAWPLRQADNLRLALQRVLGPGHLLWKASALLASAALLYAVFAHWDYRVGAAAQLATDSTRVLSAQIDGRVESALVSAGQVVKNGDLLAQMDTRELRQQETDLRAELKRTTAEADRARAASQLAELEVANARGAQAQVRLARTLDQLAQAELRAPFDGVVVEGERKELQGAPLRKGEKLYRIARIEGLYATLQVPERDAALVEPGARGELVLVSRPNQTIPLRVLAVIPVAQTKGAEGNHFLVRAELLQAPEDWWRPGMSGTARIDAGERQVGWILTHRLVDSVRLWLWW